MNHTPLFATLLLLPVLAQAYTISTNDLPYTDAPFTNPVAAGVRVLTDLKAISGNPDGTFAPLRTLNRAEFTKIALLSGPLKDGDVFEVKTCFPDVRESDWFSPYVCYAKEQGILSGYPDGTFKPAQAVNYAEALKILGELYSLKTESMVGTNWSWYAQYVDAAKVNDTEIDVPLAIDAKLTRGHIAELAAAYYMHSVGMQAEFNALKLGTVSSSSQSTSFSSSSTSSSASSTSSSSSSSTSSMQTVQSQIVLPNTTTQALVGGEYTSMSDAVLRSASVRFEREVESFDSIELRLADGTVLATLVRGNFNNKDMWEADVTSEFAFTANTPVTLFMHAKTKAAGSGFQSGENITPRSVRIFTQNSVSGASEEIVGPQPPFATHITASNTLSTITSSDQATGSVQKGANRLLATINAVKAVETEPLLLKEILFTVEQSNNVTLSNVRISRADGPALYDNCNVQGTLLRCILLKEELQLVTATPLHVTADIEKSGHSTGSVQLRIQNPGAPGVLGDLRFNDNITNFTWFTGMTPVWLGTEWVVEK